MTRPLFTTEELAELAAYDAEVDADDLTQEEIRESRARDREAKLDALDHRGKRIAEQQRAYKAANRERIAEKRRKQKRPAGAQTPTGRNESNHLYYSTEKEKKQ